MKTKKSRSKPIVVIAIIVALLGLYFAIAWFYRLVPFQEPRKALEPGDHFINMERTETEKQGFKDLQENPENKTKTEQTDVPEPPMVDGSTGKQEVNVLLTNAGVFNNLASASGMVTNSVEEGGLCTFVFSNGNSEITKTSSTLANPTSTSCETVSFPASELPSGNWKVFLRYASDSSFGISNAKEFAK